MIRPNDIVLHSQMKLQIEPEELITKSSGNITEELTYSI